MSGILHSLRSPLWGGKAARDYDGTNDYAARTTALAGIADSSTGTFSTWFRLDGGDAAEQRILAITDAGNSARFTVTRLSTNKIEVRGASTTAIILQMITTPTYIAGTTWRHILASWTLGATSHIYIDDAIPSLDTNTATAGSLNVNNPNVTYGSRWNSGAYDARWNGCLCETLFHTTYLDLSVESNRRKFRTANGRPAFLGADGSLPLGVQPLLYAPNGDPSTNAGSGGNFTVTGSLDAASTVPG